MRGAKLVKRKLNPELKEVCVTLGKSRLFEDLVSLFSKIRCERALLMSQDVMMSDSICVKVFSMMSSMALSFIQHY